MVAYPHELNSEPITLTRCAFGALEICVALYPSFQHCPKGDWLGYGFARSGPVITSIRIAKINR
jgi:hypothetical protein